MFRDFWFRLMHSVFAILSLLTFAPLLTPADEIRLQAQLADHAEPVGATAILNVQMRNADIRVSLEDARRLHFQLG